MRTLFYVLLGYASGSVLFARVMTGLMGKEAVLEQSRDCNPGTANAFTYGGFWCGVGTLAGDLLKGFLPVWLFLRGNPAFAPLALSLVVAAPVLGHTFPVFYRLHGGKGIATTFGCLLGLLPMWQPLAFFVGAFLLFSLVIRVSPHFYRTVFAYLFTLAVLLLTKQSAGVVLGFALITALVCLRLHMSKEPRQAIRVCLF